MSELDQIIATGGDYAIAYHPEGATPDGFDAYTSDAEWVAQWSPWPTSEPQTLFFRAGKFVGALTGLDVDSIVAFQPKVFPDADIGVPPQASGSLPAPRGCYPEEWGPSFDRRLTCACGNSDPCHWQSGNEEVSGRAAKKGDNE